MATASIPSGAIGSSPNNKPSTTMSGVDPERARKRRKEILASTRQSSEKRLRADSSLASCSAASTPGCAMKGKTKYQNRYDPEVPMSKKEAAEWRREARRKRNRESAAASRNKVRSRINELETEVEEWKSKYAQLLERIDTLESFTRSTSSMAGSNATVPCAVSPAITPTPTPVSLALHLDSLPINLSIPAIEASFSDETFPKQNDFKHQAQTTGPRPIPIHPNNTFAEADQEFHVIEMTSRPA